MDLHAILDYENDDIHKDDVTGVDDVMQSKEAEYNFIEEHTGVAITYLIAISLAGLLGTFGNILIIAAVLVEKVRFKNTSQFHR